MHLLEESYGNPKRKALTKQYEERFNQIVPRLTDRMSVENIISLLEEALAKNQKVEWFDQVREDFKSPEKPSQRNKQLGEEKGQPLLKPDTMPSLESDEPTELGALVMKGHPNLTLDEVRKHLAGT